MTDEPMPAPDEPTQGRDMWRLAGALTVLGLAFIGAAILANRAAAPVRPVVLPADDLAEQYREGYTAGVNAARAAAEEELDRLRLEVDAMRAPQPGPLVVVPDTPTDPPTGA